MLWLWAGRLELSLPQLLQGPEALYLQCAGAASQNSIALTPSLDMLQPQGTSTLYAYRACQSPGSSG
jgi:hypothetical protein